MTEASFDHDQYLKDIGVSVRFEFVPFSKSRNAKPDPKPNDLSLNWKATLVYRDRDVLTLDYQAGVGHCPAYKKPEGHLWSLHNFARIKHECEHGYPHGGGSRSKCLEPKPADVVHCILMDGSAIDHPVYEEWANDYGFDPDSRKGEAIYKQCLEIGLRLRSSLGETLLMEMREKFSDY